MRHATVYHASAMLCWPVRSLACRFVAAESKQRVNARIWSSLKKNDRHANVNPAILSATMNVHSPALPRIWGVRFAKNDNELPPHADACHVLRFTGGGTMA